ncbi:MAG: TM0106 family RecB-like putative nuclease [Athalassotoga sp.]
MTIDQMLLTIFYLCHRKAYLLRNEIHQTGNLSFEADYGEIHLVAFADEMIDDGKNKTLILNRTSKSVRERHTIESAFLSFVMELRGEKSEVVVNFLNGQKKIKSHDELILMMINSMKESFEKPSPPNPVFSYACKGCPFYPECIEISSKTEDISLINGIGEKRKKTLLKAGFTDLKSISNANPQMIASYTGIELKEANAIVKQATAISKFQLILIEKPDLPKSDHEYFFDVEKSDKELYLFGVFHEGTYHSFIIDTDDWESSWKAFLEFISKYPSAPIYHYDRFDKDVIQKFANISKTKSEDLLKRFVDLYSTVRKSLAIPVKFYSLKDVAGILGFKWKNPNFKGYDAMLALGKWKRTKDQSIMKEVLEYNEDDCKALKVLKERLVEMINTN